MHAIDFAAVYAVYAICQAASCRINDQKTTPCPCAWVASGARRLTRHLDSTGPDLRRDAGGLAAGQRPRSVNQTWVVIAPRPHITLFCPIFSAAPDYDKILEDVTFEAHRHERPGASTSRANRFPVEPGDRSIKWQAPSAPGLGGCRWHARKPPYPPVRVAK